MWASNFRSAMLTALSAALITVSHSQDYSRMEANAITCPERDKCEGYRNNLTYMDRSCECDFNCTAYKDCCIDALPRPNSRPRIQRPPPRTDVKCLHYGNPNEHTGVFVISTCSNSWNGARKIKERCISNSDDFTDPLTAVPVTDVHQKKTYRNLACAECNNANLASLLTFHVGLDCDGIDFVEDQIWGDLTYNQRKQSWGVNRLNDFENGTEFRKCSVFFDVPGYLNASVRFCRSNLISTCASNWTRPQIATSCSQYMAVVYTDTHAYRNPDCAICNYKTVSDIFCGRSTLSRNNTKRPMSFALLLDVNQSDGSQVGMRQVTTPQCPSGHKYDPFFKKCRRLVCALPGHNVVDGRCVRG